jgi:mRNA-degrading endonuclease RelE of RelBE toxin-antitoxin system
MINLKYSKDVIDDYKKLSDGRKSYIKKRVKKLDVTVSDYLMSKYMGVNNNNNDEEKNV